MFKYWYLLIIELHLVDLVRVSLGFGGVAM